jgi:fumarate hydratase, class II
MVTGSHPNREHIAENPAKPLTLVTALNLRIGYDKRVRIGKTAPAGKNASRHIAAKPGFVRTHDIDRRVVPGTIALPSAVLEGGGG